MSKAKRVRLTDESINSYGTRILTDGLDISQFERNPVLLYMHRRGEVIGILRDIRKEGTEITAELVFDEVTEKSKQSKQQWDFGSLRMVSVGIDILEFSEDPKHLVEGQRHPTVTRSKLNEVSVVDYGANDNAIVLYYEGKKLELSGGGESPLPLLTNKPTKEMETKLLAMKLGLSDSADDAAIMAKIETLQAAAAESEQLKTTNEQLTLARITACVDRAIAEKKITDDKKDHFLTLGKQVGAEALEKTIGMMSPMTKITAVLGHQGGAPTQAELPTTYAKLSDVPSDVLVTMRTEDRKEYARLFKAEYGYDPEIEE